METAKIFQNGNSQAVRLPKAFRFPGDEVRIYKQGDQVILEPLEPTWDALFESLSEFPDDFFEHGRRQPPMQERESLRVDSIASLTVIPGPPISPGHPPANSQVFPSEDHP